MKIASNYSFLRNDRNGMLLIGTSLTIVLISSNLKPLRRVLDAFVGRLQLYMYILPNALKGSINNKENTDDDNTGVITALFYYPVKSLRAVPINVAVLGNRGFIDDRRYMIVRPAPIPLWGSFGPNDATHRFITQRQFPILTQISVIKIDNDTLQFSNKINDKVLTISSEPQRTNPKYRSTIWNDIAIVQDMGDDIAAYLTEIVNQDPSTPEEYKTAGVRLVTQCDEDHRISNDTYIPGSARHLITGNGPKVALSDGFPILVASEESLEELNRRLQEKGKESLPMSRFRPNIVIRGLKRPFAEDDIKVLQIIPQHGKQDKNDQPILLHIVKGCPRCKESCTDQETGQVTAEPLETLREFRALNVHNADDLYFAQNAVIGIHSYGSTISIGDQVKVIQWGKPVFDSWIY